MIKYIATCIRGRPNSSSVAVKTSTLALVRAASTSSFRNVDWRRLRRWRPIEPYVPSTSFDDVRSRRSFLMPWLWTISWSHSGSKGKNLSVVCWVESINKYLRRMKKGRNWWKGIKYWKYWHWQNLDSIKACNRVPNRHSVTIFIEGVDLIQVLYIRLKV